MRTNIVLDDQLVSEAMRLTHAQTKKEVVDRALRDLVGRDLIDPDYDVRAVRAGMARDPG